jgi:Ca2+-binding EF-hand superfamily protein
MRVAAAFLVLSAGIVWTAGPPRAEPAGPVLVFPGGPAARLRLEVTFDGQHPEVRWSAFLDALFDFLDRDGDGWLSPAEVARMPPLPLPGGRELTADFANLDANRDGRASRAELKAFCRAGGFAPVVVVVRSPSADDLRLAAAFQRRLDANGDGILTRAELCRAPVALSQDDLNDDEYLEVGELLSSAPPAPPPRPARVTVRSGSADATLRVELGARPAAALRGKGAGTYRLTPAPAGAYRLVHPTAGWALLTRAERRLPDVSTTAEFLAAQLTAAGGDRAPVKKADLDQDPASAGLVELFHHADRDGDGRLSLAELAAYLKLVERGVAAQVWVTVHERGRNPFGFLDTDGDGRLSYVETTRAADLLFGRAEASGLPRQFELSLGGPTAAAWGGVQLPALARRKPPALAAPRPVPRWFRAMDRNGDGVISPREWPGPPEVFRKLDLDGDGVISAEEAARAGGR